MKRFLASAFGAISVVASSHGAVLIGDSFGGMNDGEGLPGRTPETTIPGATWTGSTANLLSNGNGALEVGYVADQPRTASINLGAGYLAANPGVYELSMDVTHPTGSTSNSSWVGLGFMSTNVNTSTFVSNSGSPWMLYRLNGQVSVYAGPGTGNQLVNNSVSTTHGAALGGTHTMKLVLDTSAPNWLLRAFIGGYEFDLNGAAAGTTYTFTTNPTSGYIGFGNGVNAATGEFSTVDNFQLTFIPEPGVALLSSIAALALLKRRRG